METIAQIIVLLAADFLQRVGADVMVRDHQSIFVAGDGWTGVSVGRGAVGAGICPAGRDLGVGRAVAVGGLRQH